MSVEITLVQGIFYLVFINQHLKYGSSGKVVQQQG